jgi:hypothetical protein
MLSTLMVLTAIFAIEVMETAPAGSPTCPHGRHEQKFGLSKSCAALPATN